MIHSVDGFAGFTVGTVARMSGVSVRTLHHYDEIGLVAPAGRSESGYRLYDDEEISRLRRVLFYRELEFGLDEIAAILADPAVCIDDHLRRQHRLLRDRQARTAELLAAIEHEMEARQMGISLTPEEQLEIFGTDKIGTEYEQEAEHRWGQSDAWKQSRKRTAAYTKEDWIEIKREADENIAGFVAAVQAGEPADGTAAMNLAEAYREHLSRWFYDCDHAMLRNLAEMYVCDPRFKMTWDEHAPDFARYVHDAIVANADRAEG